MKIGWSQSAHGAFECGIRPGTAHCGMEGNSKITIEYKIRLEFRADGPDSQGFLIDNLFFAQYFAPFKDSRVEISCEKLAETIANQLCELSRCYSLTVELSAIPGVWISVHCLSPKFAHLWDECPARKLGPIGPMGVKNNG